MRVRVVPAEKRAFSISKVKDFWDERAIREGISSGQVTHKDIWQRWLEIEMISSYLHKNDRVLDVGCGNGHSTRILSRFCKEIIGIDYSEAMINRAREESRKKRKTSLKHPIFFQCDALDLNPSLFGTFDVVISERCLINLSSFEKQKKAIANIASVLKPKGKFIFIEGSADGRKVLNKFRKMVGLSAMPRVWHNIDFKETETVRYLKNFFMMDEYKHFGVYDFISRVVHPLLVSPEEPKYDAKINEIAARLALETQEFGDISRVMFLVLSKK